MKIDRSIRRSIPLANGDSSKAESVPPQQKMPRLIVVLAFDCDEDGELVPVFGPAEQQSEDRAVRTALALADKHVRVIAWSREANIDLGEYGPPTVLFQAREVPDMK